MDESRPVVVRLEQPTANKVTVFLIAGLAGYLTLLFLSRIDAGAFAALPLVFLAAVLIYAYRAIQVVAIADTDGISVRNLVRRRDLRWSEIDVMSVGKVGNGPGTGITIEFVDGSTMPVEASWGQWYQGKAGADNTVRCERFIERINMMRAHDPDLDEPGGPPTVDPFVVRPSLIADADAVAETIDAAWRETYAGILPEQTIHGRDQTDDAAMLCKLLDGSIPGAGSLVVERAGEIVGASMFGPTKVDGLDGFTEIFMIYVRSGEVGGGAGRRLVIRTFGAIRNSGARGIVGHVYVRNRPFRDQIEGMGIEPHGDPQEQIWYGLPVRVVEYRLTL
ncbi:MAG: hypothetical protein ACC683_13630 [Acidimicrobiia bacterium]